MEIKCSRRLFLSESGFTLIELLVVVLIIGILAAVALPQYNKAVRKAQAAEALAAIDAYDKALADYYLNYGTYDHLGTGQYRGIQVDKLTIQMPELKFWEYLQASGGFSSTFQVGCGSSTTAFMVLQNNNKKSVKINADWEKGKMSRFYCAASFEDCSKYFNCIATEITEQVCPAEHCPMVTTKYCYLE